MSTAVFLGGTAGLKSQVLIRKTSSHADILRRKVQNVIVCVRPDVEVDCRHIEHVMK